MNIALQRHASDIALQRHASDIPEGELSSCVYCSSNAIYEHEGYIVCSECATILQYIVFSEEPEWTNYEKSRCGPNEDELFSNISTKLTKGSQTYICKDNLYVKSDIYNLHVQLSYNCKQKSYNNVETTLDNYMLNYPEQIKRFSKKLWSEIVKTSKIRKGNVRKGLIMCCIYYGCLENNCNKLAEDICLEFNLDISVFNKGDKEFKEIFSMIPEYSYLIRMSISPEFYFNSFCAKLRYMDNFKLVKNCIEFYNAFKSRDNYGPKVLTCAIIYHVCILQKIPINKKQISDKLDISLGSLNKMIIIISKNIDII